jgi:hypothetical protein
MRGMKGYTNTRFFIWKKVMPSFEYKPLVLHPKLNFRWGEDKGDTHGPRPSGTRAIEELGDLRGGEDSPKRKVVEHTLK